MTELIERVARAVCKAFAMDYHGLCEIDANFEADKEWENWIPEAKAAIAAMQADAAPVAWLYQNEVQQEYVSRVRHEFRTQGVIQWTETPLYAHPPVDDRVSTSSPVDDRETPNTSVKLRDAVEVYQHAYVTWVSDEHENNAAAYAAAAAIIEQDREAVRAAVVAEIVAWLRGKKTLIDYNWLLAKEIEAKFGGNDGK